MKCRFYRQWILRTCAVGDKPYILGLAEAVDYYLSNGYRKCPLYLKKCIRKSWTRSRNLRDGADSRCVEKQSEEGGETKNREFSHGCNIFVTLL